jgi:hypothetical protein
VLERGGDYRDALFSLDTPENQRGCKCDGPHADEAQAKTDQYRPPPGIALLSVQGLGVREIARRIGRSPSTVSRELTRNAATRGGYLEYRASVAQWKAERFAKRPKPSKLATNARLRQYVQERLEGKVYGVDGREISGPRQAPFKGRNKPHRGDRTWVNGWSPEQISNRFQVDFPDDESMRISHEAIYQALQCSHVVQHLFQMSVPK